MKYIQADIVVTHTGNPISYGIVGYNESTGKIHGIYEQEAPSGVVVDKRNGVLIPGYVNAHCHLELSHLKDVIPSGTGLIEFIKGVIQLRDFPSDEIECAIVAAEKEMSEAGIVAVGDISNTTDTLEVKHSSTIRFKTFVEAFDLFQQELTDATFERYYAVYKKFIASMSDKEVSMVPHAPYSVSKELFEKLSQVNGDGSVISIHNQEVAAENQLFLEGDGAFLNFYRYMNLKTEDIPRTGNNSLKYAIDHMNPAYNTLLVHNTMTASEDCDRAHNWSPNVFWVTCPNANLYIENKLPDYHMMLRKGAKMCIGTDSLSSNWQLSIFEEIKTIKKFQSRLSDLELIRWATLNGAEALGYDDLGKIEAGISPGLNLIDVPVRDGVFDLREAKSSIRIA